jgi:hypothetical protein
LIPVDGNKTVTISYDEKPGIQAIANTTKDLRPSIDHGFVGRDSEHIRLRTVIEFLKIIDLKYTEGDKIRLVLDNHSAHTSK